MTLDVVIERFSDLDLAPLRELFATYFPPGDRLLTTEYSRWLYAENPFGRALMVKVLEAQRWVGFMAMVPVTLTKAGQDLRAYYVVNVLVHPDFYGKFLFGRMIKAAMLRVTEEQAAMLGHPNDLALKSWQRARMHFHDALRPVLALPRPWSWNCRVHTAASVDDLASLALPLKALLLESASWRVAASPEYHDWRFMRHPSTKYRIQLVEWRDELVGVQISKRVKPGVNLLIDQIVPSVALTAATGKLPFATVCFSSNMATHQKGSGKKSLPFKKRIPFFLTRPAESISAPQAAFVGFSPSDF